MGERSGVDVSASGGLCSAALVDCDSGLAGCQAAQRWRRAAAAPQAGHSSRGPGSAAET